MAVELTDELLTLKAQAEGREPFAVVEKFEAMSELEGAAYRALSAADRLALGFYVRARILHEEGARAEVVG